jgi:hypothetical protein
LVPGLLARGDGLRRTLALGLAVALAATGCRGGSWGGVKMAPGTPGQAALDDPARAVLERFVPQRANDRGFVALVDSVLRSGRGHRIAFDARQSVGELDAIRQVIVSRGLPSVFLGIPMWESYLDTDATSGSCAAGAWQLMPETAVELGLAVQDCQIGSMVWSPALGTTSSPDSPYRNADGTCGISTCSVDERRDLSRSTVAALDLLGQSFGAPDVAASSDRAALTILAYNTGLGAVRQRMAAVMDPFVGLDECARNDCPHLGRVAALYVPGVAASAALSTCGAAQEPDSPFADEAQTTLCQSLEKQGLLPTDDRDLPSEGPAIADAEP